MSEICRVELRRPNGTVLVSWMVPLGSAINYCPPIGCEPQGMVEVWCDSGVGYDQLGDGFVWTGHITVCPPPPNIGRVGIRMKSPAN